MTRVDHAGIQPVAAGRIRPRLQEVLERNLSMKRARQTLLMHFIAPELILGAEGAGVAKTDGDWTESLEIGYDRAEPSCHSHKCGFEPMKDVSLFRLWEHIYINGTINLPRMTSTMAQAESRVFSNLKDFDSCEGISFQYASSSFSRSSLADGWISFHFVVARMEFLTPLSTASFLNSLKALRGVCKRVWDISYR